MKSFLLVTLFAAVLSSNVYSTVYYVSSEGNDLNPGISQLLPWQSISKVNSMNSFFIPGDRILFRSGDTFFGTVNITKSGLSGLEIVVGNYGTGALPVITGKKLITNWTLYSGNIYKTNVPDSVAHIYVNQKLMTIARYPDQGYLKLDATIGNTGLIDAELNQSSGYWIGANCRLRTANWAYETRVISNHTGNSIYFASPTLYTTSPNYGYYLDNKLELLDSENEWFQDKTTRDLYFYAPGGVDPNNIDIEAVVLRDGVFVTTSRHYIRIENLKFIGFADMGVNAYTSNNFTVTDCDISQIKVNAVGINGSNITITNNLFSDNLSNAIDGVMTNGLIKNNNIKRTGLYPGYGKSGRGYLGMAVHTSKGLTIENNVLDSTGYSGLSVGKNLIVKNNFINHSLLVLNDGAGIDIADSDTLKILNNIVLNTIGSTISSGNPALYGSGIYVNAGILKNSLIQNNTSAYNTYAGLYIDHKNTPVNNVVSGNVLYNNLVLQMLIADYSAVVYVPAYNTVYRKNICYSLSAYQTCMELRGHTSGGLSDYGDMDSNYYCNPYSEFPLKVTTFLPVYATNVYTLPGWKNTFNKDLHSSVLPFSLEQYAVTDTLSNNLITNSKFTSNLSGWVTWPGPGSTITQTTNPNLDGGCMKIKWNGIGHSECLTLSNTYPISIGQTFLVSLSYAGNHSGTVNLWGRSSISDSTTTFTKTFLSYENYRKDYSFTFKASHNDPGARLSVGLKMPDSVVFVDNINVYRVNVEKIDSTKLSKIFFNDTKTINSYSLNGINYKDLEGNPVTGSVVVQPYASVILIDDGVPPSKDLHLKVFIESLHNPNTFKMTPDTASVYIRNFSAPFSIVDSCRSIIDSNGNGTFQFSQAANSVDYYISIKQRNSIETWSNGPSSFASNQLNYDFTTDAGKAYGNNLIPEGADYCIYSGDINNDGQVEMSDLLQIFNSASNFASGYVVEDLNGDLNVDLDDLNTVYNNAKNFVSALKP